MEINKDENFINEYNVYITIPKTSQISDSNNILTKHYLCPNCNIFPKLNLKIMTK